MSIFDFFKKNKPKPEYNYAQFLSGYTPIFSQFGQNIFASDVVQQCINCITMELKKLTPTHIKTVGNDKVPVNSKIQNVLNKPNDTMTTSDFIEKVVWNLFLNYNSFIIPTYKHNFDGTKELTSLYPISPTVVEFQQNALGELFIHFKFINSYETTLKYNDVIHVKYRYSVNDFLGGNMSGQPDNDALLETLELNKTLLEGIGKSLKSSFAINGIVKYNTLLDDGKTERALEELEERLANSESGFMPMDLKGDFIPFSRDIQLVDDSTLKFIDEKILRQFGVSLPILTGDYTKEQYEAFYQKTLEPIIISLGQEFTRKLFTDREQAFTNEIVFYPHELIFMSTDQKIGLFDILVDSGSCYKNELRTAFGLSPLEELAGQLAMSSNKTNAENNSEEGANTDEL